MKLTVSIPSDRNPPARFPWLWLFLLSAGLMLAAGMLIWLLQNRSPGVKAMPPSGSGLTHSSPFRHPHAIFSFDGYRHA